MLETIVGHVRRNLVAIVIAIVALGGTTLAVAASGPGSSKGSTRIYACVTAEFRTLNLSSASARCPSGQRKISWSANGRKGDRGSRGAAGQAGAPGAAGAPGPIGPMGLAGAPGLLGPVGPAGPAGPIGPTGADGAIGPVGATGPVGAAGAAGPVGPAGEDGPQGPAGPPGPAGLAGDDGQDGAVGPVGPAGPAGADGPTGPEGPAGPQGPAGSTSVVQVLRTGSIPASAPRTTLDNWTVGVDTLAGFDATSGVFTATQAGTYRVAFEATAGPTTAVTTSTGANTWFSLGLRLNGSSPEVVAKRFPVLDTNIALVLTLRVPVREASVSAERYLTLAAGDVLDLGTTNQFGFGMNIDASLSITRVS